MIEKLGLSERDRRALIGGVVAVVVLATIGRGVPALRTWQAGHAAESDAAAQRLFALRRGIAVLPALRDSVGARRGRLAAIDSTLLSGETPSAIAAQLVSSIEDLADNNSFKVNSLQLRADTVAVGGLARVDVRLTGVTDIMGLAGFLRDVEGGVMPLAVREIGVSQPEPAGPDTKAEMLRVEVLVRGIGVLRGETNK